MFAYLFALFRLILPPTMERPFSPCTRLHYLLAENQDEDLEYMLPDHFVEDLEEMMLDVSTDEFLSTEGRICTPF